MAERARPILGGLSATRKFISEKKLRPAPLKLALMGWPTWSRDSRYLYVMSGSSIFKVTIPDGRSELAASVAGIDNLTPALPWTGWFGLTPDDRILIMRDRGVDEIYVLDLEYR